MNFSKDITQYEILKKISRIAREKDILVYVVGGFVRDLILKRVKNEIDFLVIGDGVEFAEFAAKKLEINFVSVFKNFGTAHFVYNQYNLEFVGARKESYSKNSRNPEVIPGSFEDDISRRDFTINTLAISLNKSDFGELIDIFNGYADITNKLIRTPLNPQITFNDDPLRILRAFRFASQLKFNISDEVLKAAEILRERLSIISQERITDEFLKILSSPKPSIGLMLLYNSKIMSIIFPEIAELGGVEQRDDYHHKDVFLHTCEVVDNVAKVSDNLWLRFSALVHDIAKPPTKKFIEGTGWTFHGHDELGARMMKNIFRRMKLPFARLEYIETMIRLHLRPIALVDDSVTDSAIRRLIIQADEFLDDLIILCRADITSKNPNKVNKYLNNYDLVMEKVKNVKEKDKLKAFQSPVRGDKIMEICGLKPGKKVGEIKKYIEDAILDGEIPNTYDAAYEFLLKNKGKFVDH